MTSVDPSFGQRVRAGMAAAGITSATDLGRRLNISRQYASRLMHGELSDSFELLTSMGALFGFSATWLRYGAGSPSPRPELSPNESRLIALYRKAPRSTREAALEILSGGTVSG